MLPNELVAHILQYVPPLWHVLCKFVCRRWHLLLMPVCLQPANGFMKDVICGGHLEVLQWARSQGCPWNEDTCAHAAQKGYLEVLQWARMQGGPLASSHCNTSKWPPAAAKRHMSSFQAHPMLLAHCKVFKLFIYLFIVASQPLQHLQMASASSIGTCPHIPGTVLAHCSTSKWPPAAA